VTDPRPKLVAVGSASKQGSANRAQKQRRRWTDLGLGFWLLAVILIVAAVVVALQARRLDELQGQVESLEGELSTTRGALQGYETRFGEIRESVGGLRAQLGELEELVEEPPEPAPTR